MRSVLSLLVALALAVVLASCGGGDDGDDAPQAGDVPAGAVATVNGVEISNDDLDAQVAVLARAQRGKDKKPSSAERKQLQAQALSTLLQRQALEQEAKDRGVKVTKAEVRKQWSSVSRSQFKTRKALRRFLGGQTLNDLLAQLRLQTLSERILQQVSEEAGGGKEGAKAAKEFQKEFQQRWQEQTACAKGFKAAGCADDSQ